MTDASPPARAAAARWVAVALLVLLALFAAPAQTARADGVISGVTKDQAGTPISVSIFLFTSPGGAGTGSVDSDPITGAFSFASVPDGDYTLTTATNSGYVGTSTAVTVAGGAAGIGTISLYRFGTVSGTILNFSVVQQTMQIWVDRWTGSGWSTVSTTLVSPPGAGGHAYTAYNAIPGPGYYRVAFVPDPGDAFLRTYSGDHAETFPGGDPSVTSIIGAFQATAYEQSFTGIDVTLALPVSPPTGGSSGGGISVPTGTHTGGSGSTTGASPVTDQPTAEPQPTPDPQPTTQQQAAPEPEPTAALPATEPIDPPADLWLFGALAILVVIGAGGLGWLVFRRR